MRIYKMTWVANRRGWMKEYKGKKYAVSCRQLGAPENKAESYQAANAWWQTKKRGADAASLPAPRTPQPLEDLAAASLGQPADLFGNVRVLLEQALLREEEQRQRGEPLPAALPGIADDANVDIVIDDQPEDAETIKRREVMGLLERLLFGDAKIPPAVGEQLPPARVAQVERAALEFKGASSAEPERTVKANVQRWVERQQSRALAGKIAPDHADLNRICLNHFAGFLGETADVSTIDAIRLEDFYIWCLQKTTASSADKGRKMDWSDAYAKKVFDTARKFTRSLWAKGLIELPRNVDDKEFSFSVSPKKIPTWTAEEVRRVIDESPGQLKLHLLLMANCGYTQADISDLLGEEVDWRAARIVRKRSKTGDKDSTPTVNYKLWPITFQLLKQYRSGAERVLLTESGKPFVRKELVDGKLIKADGIASNYAHLKRRLKFRKPLKQLRKTSASLLENHTANLPSGELVNPYAGCVSLFLGHSPRSIKDKNYSTPPAALFDSAVMWLGQQYGFVGA